MFARLKKWWQGPTDSEFFDRGYAYAAKEHRLNGDDYLIHLEVQSYAVCHPFDDGVREFVRVRKLEIKTGKTIIHPDNI